MSTAIPQRSGWWSTIRRDFLSSIVVFLVALPLCVGIAKACGLPPAAGIITGIIGGILVGMLAGAPLQVSGPAAGLILVVTEILDGDHGIHYLAVALVLAGVLQIVAGLLRLGQWFRAVSPAVIEGMLAGIGIVIIAKQFHYMVDGRPPLPPGAADDGPRGTIIDSLATIPGAVGDSLFSAASGNSPYALVIGLIVIATMILWRPLAPGALKVLPGAFIAAIIGTLVSFLMPEPLRTIPPMGDFLGTVQQSLVWPHPSELLGLFDARLLEYTITLAFVASAETLLCASAVDKMHTGPRTKFDRELCAQGVGNLLCGLFHALPMTGVIVRSKANVEAGAQSRLSTILHGVWLLVFVALLPFVLAYIPIAVLAGILVFTGFKLINYTAIKDLREAGWAEVGIFVVTVVGVVSLGLLEGVVIGMALSILKLAFTFSRLSIRTEEDPRNRRTILHLEGAATFLRLPQLAAALEKVPANTELHVQFDRLSYIDHACLNLLINWEKQHEATGGSLVIDWETLTARFHQQAVTNNGHVAKPMVATKKS